MIVHPQPPVVVLYCIHSKVHCMVCEWARKILLGQVCHLAYLPR